MTEHGVDKSQIRGHHALVEPPLPGSKWKVFLSALPAFQGLPIQKENNPGQHILRLAHIR